MSNHDPWGPARPCWHCTSFDGMAYQGTVALCSLAGGPRVRSSPGNGGSAWRREPGTDDEPDKVPASLERQAPLKVKVYVPDLPAVQPVEWAP
jgi:hypothetical protein